MMAKLRRMILRWVLVSSIKGEVKKNTPPAAGSFLGSQPTCLSRICSDLPHPCARLLSVVAQRFRVPLSGVFIVSSQRSRFVPKPAKQHVVKLATIVLSETFRL